MDLDVIHKQVQGLIAFRTKVENLIEHGIQDAGAETGVDSLSGRLTALEETVTGIQKALDDLGPKLGDLPAILEGVSGLTSLSENKDRLLAAADWVEQNKEQVAVLLSIGDDLAGTGASSGGASGATAGGTDSVSVGAGNDTTFGAA